EEPNYDNSELDDDGLDDSRAYDDELDDGELDSELNNKFDKEIDPDYNDESIVYLDKKMQNNETMVID
ncbi:8549_t:CDS:1, partial [Cetraspora pellucida]